MVKKISDMRKKELNSRNLCNEFVQYAEDNLLVSKYNRQTVCRCIAMIYDEFGPYTTIQKGSHTGEVIFKFWEDGKKLKGKKGERSNLICKDVLLYLLKDLPKILESFTSLYRYILFSYRYISLI